MSGRVGDLSAAQETALNKLREAVSDLDKEGQLPENDNYFYLRWLRANKFSVNKAEKSIRNHIDFRKSYDLDTILDDWTPPEVLVKFLPGAFFEEDREGHPVWYDRYGNLDFRGLHRSAKKEDIIKFKALHLEMTAQVLKACSAKHGRHIETVTSVIDLENLSYQRHYYWPGINIFRELLSMFEANYPERTKRIIVLKAPKVFPIAYNLIKPFMYEETRGKVVILGNDWQEELQKYISPDQLPQAYGGTRCEPDPCCSDFITQGGDIPHHYYLTNLTETNRDDMERVVVGRGGTCEVEFQISVPRTLLSWEFVSVDYDVSFGWFLKEWRKRKLKASSKFLREVVPSQRANSHIIPEAGIHECTLVGTYILKFDNSYSWSRSKEVFYSVKLLAPNVEPHPQTHPLPMFHIEIRKQKEEESATYRTPSPSPLSSEDEFFDCFQELGNSQETATASLQQTDSFSSSSHPKTSLRLTMSTPTLAQYRTTLPTSLGPREMVITGTSISTQV